MDNNDSLKNEIASRLEESARVKTDMIVSNSDQILQLVEWIIDSYKSGGKVILFGNGGSAADAQHIAGELVGRFKLERQALPALALTTNTSILTALGNDYGYETVFSRQLEALTDKRDIVIGISTSGNSPNVIKGIETAKTKGARTVGLTGGNGGQLVNTADLVISVPTDNPTRMQEAHITIGHIVCELVEREIANNQ